MCTGARGAGGRKGGTGAEAGVKISGVVSIVYTDCGNPQGSGWGVLLSVAEI